MVNRHVFGGMGRVDEVRHQIARASLVHFVHAPGGDALLHHRPEHNMAVFQTRVATSRAQTIPEVFPAPSMA
jgi:hypothetical protein